MADNPIYTGEIQWFLNFKNPSFGRVEIAEPIKADAYSDKIKQPPNRFGRDKTIGAEEIDLQFTNYVAGPSMNPYSLLNGTVMSHLTHRLDLLIEAWSLCGGEMEVELIVSRNGNDFVSGLINAPEATTDGIYIFSCSVVQDLLRAKLDRLKEIPVDVFSDKDNDGNEIIPLTPTKILLKAKSDFQVSQWKTTIPEGGRNDFFDDPTQFNFSSAVVTFGINDTLSFIPGKGNPDEFPYVYAQNELTAVTIDITNINVVLLSGSSNVTLRVKVGVSTDTSESVNYDLQTRSGDGNAFNPSSSILIPVVRKGEFIWIYFRVTGGGLEEQSIHNESMDVKISATSTAIDTVTYSVPYVDYLRQGIKSLTGIPLDAPEFEDDGQLGMQYVSNGNLMRQRNDQPFYFTWKDEASDLMEFCADYQITDSGIFIGTFPNFYQNIELFASNMDPDVDYEERQNDRFKIQQISFGYDNYEQNKDSLNTVDSVHTQMEIQTPNKFQNDKLDVSIKKIRDPNLIETMRLAANKESTSLDTDDKVAIFEVVPIEEGTIKTIYASFEMRVLNPGTEIAILQILSYTADNDSTLSWLLLGFKNGDTVSITTGENIGTYGVLQHSATLLELVPISADPDFDGTAIVTFNYPLTDVLFQTRTNEGFSSITGISRPETYANLNYTIKHNLLRPGWSSYLHSIAANREEGEFTVKKLINNVPLVVDGIAELNPIIVSELAPKIITDKIINFKIPIYFDAAIQLMDDITKLRGYIRVSDKYKRMRKVYPTEAGMEWINGYLIGTGEIKQESDFIEILIEDGEMRIKESGYNEESIIIDHYSVNNDYVQLFDVLDIPLINLTVYSRITINGVSYNDVVAFSDALSSLLN